MARQGQRQLVAGDAVAVVGDTHLAHPAGLEPDVDRRGAGIERVFQQLLQYRGGTLDHLAGGNLVDQCIGQQADGARKVDFGHPEIIVLGYDAPALNGHAMDIILALIDFILHIDVHLAELIRDYGAWIYGILFAIIFIETGLVVMPFLPGDSLLFVAGAFAAKGDMDVSLVIVLLSIAAILGDALNYAVGRYFGDKVFAWENSRWFNKRLFDKTHAFYERHGGKTIVIARFLPFLRTFAPFVAGAAKMNYARFAMYNVSGGIFWVASLTIAGFWFGNIPWVSRNLTLIIVALIVIPGLPAVYVGVREWIASRRAKKA